MERASEACDGGSWRWWAWDLGRAIAPTSCPEESSSGSRSRGPSYPDRGWVFADEPTGELDTATAASISAILLDITRHQGVTVVVATHDAIVSGRADRVVQLVDGALIESGDQEAG